MFFLTYQSQSPLFMLICVKPFGGIKNFLLSLRYQNDINY